MTTGEHGHDDDIKRGKVRIERNRLAAAQAYASIATKQGKKVPKMVRSIIDQAREQKRKMN